MTTMMRSSLVCVIAALCAVSNYHSATAVMTYGPEIVGPYSPLKYITMHREYDDLNPGLPFRMSLNDHDVVLDRARDREEVKNMREVPAFVVAKIEADNIPSRMKFRDGERLGLPSPSAMPGELEVPVLVGMKTEPVIDSDKGKISESVPQMLAPGKKLTYFGATKAVDQRKPDYRKPTGDELLGQSKKNQFERVISRIIEKDFPVLRDEVHFPSRSIGMEKLSKPAIIRQLKNITLHYHVTNYHPKHNEHNQHPEALMATASSTDLIGDEGYPRATESHPVPTFLPIPAGSEPVMTQVPLQRYGNAQDLPNSRVHRDLRIPVIVASVKHLRSRNFNREPITAASRPRITLTPNTSFIRAMNSRYRFRESLYSHAFDHMTAASYGERIVGYQRPNAHLYKPGAEPKARPNKPSQTPPPTTPEEPSTFATPAPIRATQPPTFSPPEESPRQYRPYQERPRYEEPKEVTVPEEPRQYQPPVAQRQPQVQFPETNHRQQQNFAPLSQPQRATQEPPKQLNDFPQLHHIVSEPQQQQPQEQPRSPSQFQPQQFAQPQPQQFAHAQQNQFFQPQPSPPPQSYQPLPPPPAAPQEEDQPNLRVHKQLIFLRPPVEDQPSPTPYREERPTQPQHQDERPKYLSAPPPPPPTQEQQQQPQAQNHNQLQQQPPTNYGASNDQEKPYYYLAAPPPARPSPYQSAVLQEPRDQYQAEGPKIDSLEDQEPRVPLLVFSLKNQQTENAAGQSDGSAYGQDQDQLPAGYQRPQLTQTYSAYDQLARNPLQHVAVTSSAPAQPNANPNYQEFRAAVGHQDQSRTTSRPSFAPQIYRQAIEHQIVQTGPATESPRTLFPDQYQPNQYRPTTFGQAYADPIAQPYTEPPPTLTFVMPPARQPYYN